MGENNTVTIPMEEYKNLLEIQTRANIFKRLYSSRRLLSITWHDSQNIRI